LAPLSAAATKAKRTSDLGPPASATASKSSEASCSNPLAKSRMSTANSRPLPSAFMTSAAVSADLTSPSVPVCARRRT